MRADADGEPVGSRRRLVAAAGAALASVATGCGNAAPPAAPPRGGPDRLPESVRGDIDVLGFALSLELRTVAAYDAALPRLTGAARAEARRLRDQDEQQAGELRRAIRRLGGDPALVVPADGFPQERPGDDALRFLLATEEAAVAGHLDALTKLAHGRLRAAVAAILTGDAAHAALLRELLGEEPVPAAFVLA